MSVLVDTHCHLDFNLFDEDLPEVIARARDHGLERILVPGINLASSRAAVGISESYDMVYAAVGFHPNEGLSWNEDTVADLLLLADHPKVVAIGEIGLDYYRDRAPRDLQRRILQIQLELASDLNLPVVIHNRQASNDVLDILADWQAHLLECGSSIAERPGVLHSFSSDWTTANEGISHKFYLGISGPVTFNNARELRQTVASIPLDHLLIETDAPFLTPHPHRGKRNEPAYVRFVAEKIADIYDLPVDKIARTTTSNARKLYKW